MENFATQVQMEDTQQKVAVGLYTKKVGNQKQENV
jgi:hypothetical protein